MNRYKVYVTGHIWWPDGKYYNEYEFTAEDDEDANRQIDAIATDFWRVNDYELYRRDVCPICRQTVWECIREFSEEAAMTYAECVG